MSLRKFYLSNGNTVLDEIEPFPNDRGWVLQPVITNSPALLRQLAEHCDTAADLLEEFKNARRPVHHAEHPAGLCAPSNFVSGAESGAYGDGAAPPDHPCPDFDAVHVQQLLIGDLRVTIRIEPEETSGASPEGGYGGAADKFDAGRARSGVDHYAFPNGSPARRYLGRDPR